MTSSADKTEARLPSSAAPVRQTRRAQTAIDSGAALLFTMLVWPFPLARAALAPMVNVAFVLVLWQLLQVGYFAVCMAVWSATAGTRLMGLSVVAADGSSPSRGQRALWGALSGAVAVWRILVPVRVGESSAPERAARVKVVSVTVSS